MLTLLTFRIRDTLFGIPIQSVREINRNVECTVVPGAPESVVGLFNMRGRIVVLYDLSFLLRQPDCGAGQGSTCIVLKSEEENRDNVGFLIDRTGDVVNVEETSLEPPPAGAPGRQNVYVRSVARLGEELLLLLDPEKIIHRDGEN